MSRFSELLHGDLASLSEILEGDNPPKDMAEIRAVTSNLTRHLIRLEARVAHLEQIRQKRDPLDEALNSGDGSYRP